MNSENNRIWI